MTNVKDLLEKRANEDEDRNELHYTEKQCGVIAAIVENLDENTKQIAEKAGNYAQSVHPSYVTYIIQRLPKDKATDYEWLRERAELTLGIELGDGEEVPIAEGTERAKGMTAGPEDEEVPEDEEASDVVEGFGGFSPEEFESPAEVTENGGVTVSVTKNIPVRMTLSIPEEVLRRGAMDTLQSAAKEKPEADS